MNYWRLLLVLALLTSFSTVLAQERHAFVVGNSEYGGGSIPSLDNPVNDAIDMAEELGKLGYQIYSGDALLDLDRLTFEKEIGNFAAQLPKNAVALVYYAGHGASDNIDSYLVPVNTNLEFQSQLPDRTVSVRSIANLLSERSGGFNIILLDACRDNLLAGRGVERGLKRIGGIPRGTFIGYAASEGQIASDGTGQRNGIYTGELLDALRTIPGESIERVHKEVARRVFERTNKVQFPVYDQRFIGDFCFTVCASEPIAMPPLENIETEPLTTNEPKLSKRSYNPWLLGLGAVAVGVMINSLQNDDPDQTNNNIVLNPPTRQ